MMSRSACLPRRRTDQLGHADIRSTVIYLHTDLTIKQRALNAMASPSTKPGCYRPRDKLLIFLEGL